MFVSGNITEEFNSGDLQRGKLEVGNQGVEGDLGLTLWTFTHLNYQPWGLFALPPHTHTHTHTRQGDRRRDAGRKERSREEGRNKGEKRSGEDEDKEEREAEKQNKKQFVRSRTTFRNKSKESLMAGTHNRFVPPGKLKFSSAENSY